LFLKRRRKGASFGVASDPCKNLNEVPLGFLSRARTSAIQVILRRGRLCLSQVLLFRDTDIASATAQVISTIF